mmetsp:Transcript_45431/g.97040  ORF Transcript_45431/g.97040 Transcript_45431/m.97040 type:complete len:310 (+) Transcript_45431:776-1705(+)
MAWFLGCSVAWIAAQVAVWDGLSRSSARRRRGASLVSGHSISLALGGSFRRHPWSSSQATLQAAGMSRAASRPSVGRARRRAYVHDVQRWCCRTGGCPQRPSDCFRWYQPSTVLPRVLFQHPRRGQPATLSLWGTIVRVSSAVTDATSTLRCERVRSVGCWSDQPPSRGWRGPVSTSAGEPSLSASASAAASWTGAGEKLSELRAWFGLWLLGLFQPRPAPEQPEPRPRRARTAAAAVLRLVRACISVCARECGCLCCCLPSVRAVRGFGVCICRAHPDDCSAGSGVGLSLRRGRPILGAARWRTCNAR